MSDFCEEQLAWAFRPELYFWEYDNVYREPYWAARPLGDTDEPIRIAYLLSYYRDEGSQAWLCGMPPPIWHPSCNGHNGDSEGIVLDVYFAGPPSKHWIVDTVALSAHGYWHKAYREGREKFPTTYDSGLFGVWELEYPEKDGGQLRVYVSQGKHANYYTQDQCNDGGTFNTDDCTDVNMAARVWAGWLQNLGSRSDPIIDCVVAQDPIHPYYGSGREECYWTGARFRGWYPLSVGGADSDPYGPTLAHWGF